MAKPATAYADSANDDEEAVDAIDDAEHDRILRQFDTVAIPEQEERAAALEDRRFVSIAGAQWEGDWGDQFENSIKVEIDKTSQGVERIMDQYRANRLIANIRAVDKDASEETAETLNGMFRADFYRSGGQEIADNCFEEGIQGGYGGIRLNPEYEDDADPDNDHQRVHFGIISEADQALYWVGGKTYSKRDARGCYVISAMTPDEFEEDYPDATHDSWPTGFIKPTFDWFAPDVIRVAEYYEVEQVKQILRTYEHKLTGETRREWVKDQGPGDHKQLITEGWKLVTQRQIKRRRISKTVLSGCEVLVPKRYIAGDQIPVAPYYGKRNMVDGIERVRGHVRKAKDPQRVYNSQISKLTEQASLAPNERPVFHPEQVAGHEASWAAANMDRAPYSLINMLIDPASGQPVPASAIGKIEPPQLSPVLGALIQITAGDIKELTASDDAAAQTKSNVSADAMDIAATRIDDKASTFLDNMSQTWQRVGEIWLSMAREVYVEEKREVETMDDDGKTPGVAVLAEPATDERGNFSIRNDIAKGKYKVISDVTEATTTRRDKTVRTLISASQMAAPFSPDMAQAFLTTAIMNMDGEGMDELQAYLRKGALQSGLVKPTPEEKQELEQQAANAKPDAQAEVLGAQAEALHAGAAKDGKLADKAVADTALSKAKTVETMARAHAAHAGAQEAKRKGIFDRMTSLFQPKSTIK